VLPDLLAPSIPRLRGDNLWFIDTKLPGETIGWLLGQAEVPVAVDAIPVAKSRRLLPLLPRIHYLFCNVAQAGALAGTAFIDPREAAEALVGLGATTGVVSAGPAELPNTTVPPSPRCPLFPSSRATLPVPAMLPFPAPSTASPRTSTFEPPAASDWQLPPLPSSPKAQPLPVSPEALHARA
jgi:hypothetical protein